MEFLKDILGDMYADFTKAVKAYKKKGGVVEIADISDGKYVEKSVHDDVLERLSKAMSKSEWIIDGNYSSTMEFRIQSCDTVIFLDYTVEVCLDGIKERRGKARSDMPWIENEDDAEFVEFVKNYNSECRPQVLELLEKYSDKNIVIFKNRQKADEFLNDFVVKSR